MVDLNRIELSDVCFGEQWSRLAAYQVSDAPGRGDDLAIHILRQLVRDLHRQLEFVVNERKFNKLASRWKKETRFTSNVTKKCTHPSYQHIIGMGPIAVPFILAELKKRPGDWFWALTAITEENPITDEIAGNIMAMTEVWLKWGKAKGYLSD